MTLGDTWWTTRKANIAKIGSFGAIRPTRYITGVRIDGRILLVKERDAFFLTSIQPSLSTLNRLSMQADQIVRQQGDLH